MLLTLRHEWRLKSTEKYALDRVSGVSWERVSSARFGVAETRFVRSKVQIEEKKRRIPPEDPWAEFPTVACPTLAKSRLPQNLRFYRELLGARGRTRKWH